MNLARLLAAPVVAALAVGLAVVGPEPDDTSVRRPTDVTMTQTSYACPAGTNLTIGAGQLRAGTDATVREHPGGDDVAELENARTWRTAAVRADSVIVQQQGRASGAVGFYGGRASSGSGGGQVVGACPGVVDDAWLLGVGSGRKHLSTVILTNLADSTAAVDLELWGPEGPIDAINTEGIVVEPFSTRRIRLDDVAAGEAELAVHVHRRRGSLSAIAYDSSTGVFKGTEPVAPTLSPRREQVVPGLVAGASGRTLLLLNPGDDTARVDVDVVGRKNTFRPSGLEDLKVDAGTVRLVKMPASATADEQALRIRSDHPVAASVRLAPSSRDFAYAEAGTPLAGPAVVPVDLGSGSPDPELVLSAPDAAASVAVTAHDAEMRELGSVTVDVEAGTTRRFDPVDELDVDDVAYLVLVPRGELVGAATFARSGGIASLTLESAPVTVVGPRVRPAG